MSAWQESRNAQGEIRSFRIEVPWFSIVVTRHIRFPGTWIVNCRDAGIDTIDLQTDDGEAAKEKALEIVVDRLERRARIARHFLERGRQ